MTAFERVRRTQRSLGIVIGSSVLFWTLAVLFGLLTIGAVIGATVALPSIVRGLIPIIAVLAAIVLCVVLGWQGRFVWSFDRVALWIEEHVPELRYALVTAIDPRYQGETARILEPVVSRIDTGPFVRNAAKRSTLPAALALFLALGVFIAIPKSWKERLSTKGIFGPGRTSAVVGNRLTPLTAVVTPPAYAHLRTETLNEPSMVVSLIGSRVVLTGFGSPDDIHATLVEIPPDESSNTIVGDSANDDSEQFENAQAAARWRLEHGGSGGNGSRQNTRDKSNSKSWSIKPYEYKQPAVQRKAREVITKPLPVTAGGKGWMTSFTLSDSNPALLKLVDRQYHRDIIIDPRVDQTPTGRLLLPLRDTTMRMIEGNLSLSATFNDDIGISAVRFEYIRCYSPTGNPEEVKCIPGIFTTKSLGDAKSGDFSYTIPFTKIGLHEGDLLSVRAVVIDNNTVTGPDTGFTETRTIRIATKSEYEKLSINPSPPSADTALVTLRMLLMAVKQLDHDKGDLEHKVYQDSAIKLGGLGQQVRNKIDQIIDEQTGGGEVPVNPLLALARDSMFEAVTDLYVADTHNAIPPIQTAYDSLKKFSDVAKYFLRGIIPPLPVNITRIRLTGNDSGSTTPRLPRPMSDVDRDRYMREYVMGVQQLHTSPDNALETLTLLQVESLRKYPNLAQAIGDAISAVRAKKDPAGALLRARRALGGSTGTLDTLPLWSGKW